MTKVIAMTNAKGQTTNDNAGQETQKPSSIASRSKKNTAKSLKKDQKSQKDNRKCDSDISFDYNETNSSIAKDSVLDIKTIKELQHNFNQQLALVKAEFNGQVKVLENILKMKDEIIGNLQTEVGELRQTCNFLTHETHEIKGKIKVTFPL